MLKSVKTVSIVFSSNSIWPAYCIRFSSDLNSSVGDTEIRSSSNTHLPTCSFPNTYGWFIYMEEAEKKAAGMWFCQHLIIEISALWGVEITVALDGGTNTAILSCSHEGSSVHGSKWTPSLCCRQPLKLKISRPDKIFTALWSLCARLSCFLLLCTVYKGAMRDSSLCLSSEL